MGLQKLPIKLETYKKKLHKSNLKKFSQKQAWEKKKKNPSNASSRQFISKSKSVDILEIIQPA